MIRNAIIVCIGVLTVLCAAHGAAALPWPPLVPAGDLRVYVLTFGPGDDPWEKWGHNAIEIEVLASSDSMPPLPEGAYPILSDRTYNWGVFQFDKSFYWKFVQGKLIYQVRSDPSGPKLIDYYVHDLNRSAYRQELNLSGEQKLILRDELRRLDTDANRNYLYNYYAVNCSTKVRDAVDKAVGGKLAEATQGKLTKTTYRFHTDRLDAGTIWLYMALQGVLAHPVDRPIDQWQEMFLPMKLHDRLSEMKVQLNGYEVPLVKGEERNLSNRPPEPQTPPVMAPWFLAVGMAFGAILAVLAKFAWRHWTARWGFIVLSTPWLLLMSIGGGIIWWAWLATDHEVARNNENVMQVNVLALPLLVILPMAALGWKFASAWAVRLTWAMACISFIGLLLKLFPWFYQVNYSIIALCLPVNLALGYAAWVMRNSPVAVVEKMAVTPAK